MTSSGSLQTPPRLLVTAGPTHEPIDAVRYLANRSSGRVGIALADEAARRGWRTTMLLGPSCFSPENTSVVVRRFRTTTDLQSLLEAEFPVCDVLIMAAAVADYRPAGTSPEAKISRGDSDLSLRLEPTPDLLGALAPNRAESQRVIGFALEPQDRLLESAQRKLERKDLDAIVANPLETMDAEGIHAILLRRDATHEETPGVVSKGEFAAWLLDRVDTIRRQPR